MISKVKIFGEKGSLVVECPFNPTQLSFSKSVIFHDQPQPSSDKQKKDVQGGRGATLSLQLLFDTTLDKSVPEDVREKYIEKLLPLLELSETYKSSSGDTGRKRPPLCKVQWGTKTLIEKAFLKDMKVTYTLFTEAGLPIRARADVTFEEAPDEIKKQNPTSTSEARKTWVVTEGETLDWIAFQEYGDSSYWRYIAESNDLANPLEIRPGQILRIPPLT